MLLHPIVQGEAQTPPANPTDGECWIVSPTPTGDWVSHEGKLAVFMENSWTLITPAQGMQVFDITASQLRVFDSQWQLTNAPTSPQGGTYIDTEARQAILDVIQVLRDARILPPSAT